MKRWIAPALLLLAGCVVTGLNSGLQALVGQDISAAVKMLGYPDGARTTTGGTIYIWSSGHSALLPATGNAGSAANAQTCTIQITVDATNRIKRGQYNGNPGACAPYERALNSLNR
jgi:hypothetical protein